MGRFGWILLYIVAGFIDAIQFIIGFTGAGNAFNIFIDPFLGLALVIYLELRGVDIIKKPLRLFSVLGGFIFEMATFGMAPAWFVDIWLIHRSVKKGNLKEEKETLGALLKKMHIPKIVSGIRLPNKRFDRNKMNSNGVRLPSKETDYSF